MKRLLTVLLALAVSLFAAACGSSSPTASAPSPATSTIQAVIFSADFTALTQIGATAQVTAIGISTTGTMQDVTSSCTNWQSEDPRVLSVTSGGLLTAQSASGSALITTTCQGIAARGWVPVNPAPALPPTILPPAIIAACSNPPYTWDANPDVLRCRETNGRFALSACCGH